VTTDSTTGKRGRQRGRQRGFTLLEAIVALVLLTTAGLTLFSWINASFESLDRIEQSNVRAAAERNALEYLRTINPMARPEGRIVLGTTQMTWRAKQLAPATSNMLDTLAPGPFSVAMYEVEVGLDSPPLLVGHRFVVRQMGFSRLSFSDEEATPPPARPPVGGTR
jgi:general secretion pathway protein I